MFINHVQTCSCMLLEHCMCILNVNWKFLYVWVISFWPFQYILEKKLYLKKIYPHDLFTNWLLASETALRTHKSELIVLGIKLLWSFWKANTILRILICFFVVPSFFAIGQVEMGEIMKWKPSCLVPKIWHFEGLAADGNNK